MAIDTSQTPADSPVAPPKLGSFAGVTWQFEGEALPGLSESADDRLPLDRWCDEGRLAVVKHGAHRTVYRVDAPAGTYFLKQQRLRGWADWIRACLRPHASRREFVKANEITRREVPTIRALAWGERRQLGVLREHFLLSDAFPNACSLQAYLQAPDQFAGEQDRAACDRAIAVALARLCAAAHRAGVFHNDLHPGNILIRRDSLVPSRDVAADAARVACSPELCLIDVPGARLSRPLGWRRSRASLAMLLAALQRHASLALCLWFWRAYQAERPELSEVSARLAARELAAACRAQTRRLARQRDKRAWGVNHEFRKLRLQGRRGHATADVAGNVLEGIVGRPEQLLVENVDRPLKLSHSSVVVEAELEVEGRSRRVLFKRCAAPSWSGWLVDLVRGSRAAKGWFLGHALRARGIHTSRPLIVVVPDWYRWRQPSYLVSEWIEDAENLHLYGWHLARLSPAEQFARARRCAAVLGQLIGRMHDARVAQRDLKGCNILVVDRDERPECYVIDFHGMRIRRWLSKRQRVENLSRLAVSIEMHPWVTRTMRLRFLRAYCQQFLVAEDWKSLWRSVAVKTERRLRHIHRRGKRIA